MKNLLSIENLELFFELYKKDLKVLNKINLKIFKGEKIAFVGESGSGKSVMLRIILGLLKYQNAKIKAEEAWDGLHGVMTNMKDESASFILSQYKNLWKIEDLKLVKNK